MASNSIFDYVSNIVKSVKFAAIEAVQESMPITTNFVVQNKDAVKEMYKSILDSRQSAPRINGVQDSVIFKNVNKMFTNIKNDLKSGNFYHPEREDVMSQMSALSGLLSGMGGMGDDFMAELSSIFSGDFGEEEDENGQLVQRPEQMVTKGDALVASAFFRSQSTATNCIGKLMGQLHEHGMKTQRAISTFQSAQMQKHLWVTQNGFKATTEGFNRLIEFNNEVMRTHVQNSQKFYEDMTKTIHESNAILKSLHEIQKKIYEPQLTRHGSAVDADPTKGVDSINFQELFKNGFNLTAYRRMVQQNVQKSPTGYLYQLVNLLPMMMSKMVDNPLHELTKTIAKGVIGSQLDWAMKKLDDTISGAFSTGLAKLYDYGRANSSTVFGKIASMLGFKQGRLNLASIDMSNYEKGAMAWNGKAQKALVEVIPAYLARIEAATTGQGERYMNWKSGKFESTKRMHDRVKELDNKTAKDGLSDLNQYIESAIQSIVFDPNNAKNNRKQQRKMRKDWDKVRHGIVNRGYIDFNDMLNSANAENYGGANVANVFATLLRSIGEAHPGSLMKATNTIASANQRRNQEIQDIAKNGNEFAPLFNNSLIGEVQRKKGFDPSQQSLPPVLTDLTQLKDKRGHTLYDYQYAILKELIHSNNIRNHEGRSSGPVPPTGGMRRGHRIVPLGNRKQLNRNVDKVLQQLDSSSDYDENIKSEPVGPGHTLSENKQKKLDSIVRSKGIYQTENKAVVSYEDLLDPNNKDAMRALVSTAQGVQKNYKNDKLRRSSSIFNFLAPTADPSKYHQLPQGIDANMPFLEQLIKASDVGQKFDVIRHNIDALTDAPQTMMASAIAKADEAVYDLLFGRPTGEVDPVTGKPINGVFDKIMSELNQSFGGMNDIIDRAAKRLQDLFKDGGPLDWMKGWLKDSGIDVDKWITDARTSVGNLGRRAMDETTSALSNQVKEVTGAFTETFKDLGIIGNDGKFHFGSDDGEETTTNARGTRLYGKSKPSILSRGEAVIPPDKNPFNPFRTIADKGRGTKFVSSTGVYNLQPGSMVINAKENPFNPNRANVDLGNQERAENSLKAAITTGSKNVFSQWLPSFARGKKVVGGSVPNLFKKLNKQGTDLTAEDVNMLIEAKSPEERKKVVFKIIFKHMQDGTFANDSNGSRKKKMGYQINQLCKQLDGNRNTKQDFRTKVFGVQKDDQGKMRLNDTFDQSKVNDYLDIKNLDKKNYLQLRDIRESISEIGGDPNQLPSDEEIGKRKLAGKEGPITGIRQAALAAFGTDPKKAAELGADVVKKNAGNITQGGVTGALLSAIFPLGGPLMGAMVGAAVNTLTKSKTLNQYLFGKEVTDKDGNKVHKGGLIGDNTIKIFQKYIPDMKKYGTVGAVTGMFTPFGPLGGAMIGAAASIVKNNESLNKAIFGSGDGKSGGLFGKNIKNKIKRAFPHVAAGAIGAMLLGPFGLLGNAIIGSGLGMLSTTETFKKLMLGPKDKDGIRRGGIAGAIRRQITDPFKETMEEVRRDLGGWFKNRIFDPVADGLKPIGKVAMGAIRTGVRTMFSKATGGVMSSIDSIAPGLSRMILNKVDDMFGGVRSIGGLFKLGAKKLIGAPAEWAAGKLKNFGQSVGDWGIEKGLVNSDAAGMIDYYKRKGIDNNISKSVGKMAEMNDETFKANNNLLQLLNGTQNGKFDDDFENLKTREAQGFQTEMEKLADKYGSDSREARAIAEIGRKYGLAEDFQELNHVTSPEEIRQQIFKNTNISEENKDRIMKEFLTRARNINHHQTNMEALKDPEKKKEMTKALMDAYGYKGTEEEFLNGDMQKLAKISASEKYARQDLEREREEAALADEENKTPAEKQQEAQTENTTAISEETQAVKDLTAQLITLIEVLRAHNPDDKGYQPDRPIFGEDQEQAKKYNDLLKIAKDKNNPDYEKAREELIKSGLFTEQTLDEMRVSEQVKNTAPDSIEKAYKTDKEEGKIAPKSKTDALDRIDAAKGVAGTAGAAAKEGLKAAGRTIYNSQVFRPAKGIRAISRIAAHKADTKGAKKGNPHKGTDILNDIATVGALFNREVAENVKDYNEKRREEEEVNAKRNEEPENHAFGSLLSGFGEAMKTAGKTAWEAGKNSFKSKVKESWNNLKQNTKNNLLSLSGKIKPTFEPGGNAIGGSMAAAQALLNSGGPSGGATMANDKSGKEIMQVPTSEGDIITQERSSTDGSWSVRSTKDNMQAQAKLEAKNKVQERIASGIEAIANKLGAQTEGGEGKPQEKKGILDSLLDLLKSPLSFISGALGGVGSMISAWLAKHIWTPLKKQVSKFGSAIFGGIKNVSSGLFNFIKNFARRHPKLAFFLGLGGYLGKKAMDWAKDDETVEEADGSNAEDNGAGRLTPDEVNPQEDADLAKNAVLGFGVPMVGSEIGTRLMKNKALGSGLGGALAGGVAQYLTTGELPGISDMVINAGMGYGIHRLTNRNSPTPPTPTPGPTPPGSNGGATGTGIWSKIKDFGKGAWNVVRRNPKLAAVGALGLGAYSLLGGNSTSAAPNKNLGRQEALVTGAPTNGTPYYMTPEGPIPVPPEEDPNLAKNAVLGFGLPLAGSTAGAMFMKNKALGSGLGGALAGGAAQYLTTGELPSMTDMAIDAGMGYGIHRLMNRQSPTPPTPTPGPTPTPPGSSGGSTGIWSKIKDFGKGAWNVVKKNPKLAAVGALGLGAYNLLGGNSTSAAPNKNLGRQEALVAADGTPYYMTPEGPMPIPSEKKEEDGGFMGGLLPSLVGMKAGSSLFKNHKIIGGGLGGALANAAVGLYNGEDVSLGDIATDTVTNSIFSKIGSSLFGSKEASAAGKTPPDKETIKRWLMKATDPNNKHADRFKYYLKTRAGITDIEAASKKFLGPSTAESLMAKASKGFKAAKDYMLPKATQAMDYLGTKAGALKDTIMSSGEGLYNTARNGLTSTMDYLGTKAGALKNTITTAGEGLYTTARNGLTNVMEGATTKANSVVQGAKDLTAGLGESAKAAKDAASEKVMGIIDKVKSVCTKLTEKLSGILPKSVTASVSNFVEKVFARIIKPEVITKIAPKLLKQCLAFAATGPGMILIQAGFAIKGYFSGKDKEATAKLFQVDESKVTDEMQTLSGICNAFIDGVPILGIIISLMGWENWVLEILIDLVGGAVGFTREMWNKLKGTASETASEETEATTEAAGNAAEALGKGVKDFSISDTISNIATNAYHQITGASVDINQFKQEDLKEVKEAISSKITSSIIQIKTAILKMIPSGASNAIEALGQKLIETCLSAQNLGRGIKKLQSMSSSPSDISGVASSIMSTEVSPMSVKLAYITGTNKPNIVLRIAISAASSNMRTLSGISYAVMAGIPFLTGFIDTKQIYDLVLAIVGPALGVDKASIEKAKKRNEDRMKADQKSSQNVENKYTQAGQGKTSAMSSDTNTNQSKASSGNDEGLKDVNKVEQATATKSTWQNIKDTASSAWESAKSTASKVWEGAKSTASSAWESAKSTASDLWNRATGGKGKESEYGQSKFTSDAGGGFFNQIRDKNGEDCGSYAFANGLKSIGKSVDKEALHGMMKFARKIGAKKDGDGTAPWMYGKYLQQHPELGLEAKTVSANEAVKEADKDPRAFAILDGQNKHGINKDDPFGKNPHIVSYLGGNKTADPQPNPGQGSIQEYKGSNVARAAKRSVIVRPKAAGQGKGKNKINMSALNALLGRDKYGKSKFGKAKGGSLDGVTEEDVLKEMMYVAAGIAKKIGSKHPELFFGQLMMETGGPANYIAANKKAGAGHDHNYGGFTWYDGMGEEFRGVARPSNEGGYYATFDSADEYIERIYEDVYKSYAGEMAQVETPEQFAQTIKNHGYFADDNVAGYAAGITSGIQNYAEELKNIGNIDVSSLKTGGTGGGGSSSGGGSSKPMGLIGALAKLAAALNPFSFDFNNPGQALANAASDFKNSLTGGGGGGNSGTSTPTANGEKVSVPADGNAMNAMEAAIGKEISSPYGPRDISVGSKFHHGVDYEAEIGTKIPSLTNATVDDTGFQSGYGNYVVLKDKNSTPHYHIMAHLSNNDLVKPGQEVQKGQVVAISGDTGVGTGPHLHYGIYTDPNCAGGNGAVDPAGYSINGLGKYGYGRGKDDVVDPRDPRAMSGINTDEDDPAKFRTNKTGLSFKQHINWAKASEARKELAKYGYGQSKYGMGTEERDFIWKWLTDPQKGGLNNAAAAGIMGNIQQESTFNPHAYQDAPDEDEAPPPTEDGSNGYGICQWTGSRTQALIDYAKSKNKSSGDLETQLEYMMKEAKDAGVWEKMLLQTDPEAAAKLWDDEYEKSGTKGNRFEYAKEIYSTDGKGSLGSNSGTVTPTGESGGGGGNGIVARIMAKINQYISKNPRFKELLTMLFGTNPFEGLFGGGGSSGGGGPSGTSTHFGPINATEAGKKIVEEARSHIGKPYLMGANGPDAYDCSSHAQTSYAAAGLEVPRPADDQHDFFKEKNALVDVDQAQPGDMIFFSNTYCPGVSHVGIVTQPGNKSTIQICHASSSKGVIECGLSEWHIEHLTRDEGLPIGSLALAFPEQKPEEKPQQTPAKPAFTPEEQQENRKQIEDTGLAVTETSAGGPSTSYVPEDPDDAGLYDDVNTENPQLGNYARGTLLSHFGLGKNPYKFGLGRNEDSESDYKNLSDMTETPRPRNEKWDTSGNFGVTPKDIKASRFGMGQGDPTDLMTYISQGCTMDEAVELASQAAMERRTNSNSIATLRRQEEEEKKALEEKNKISMASMHKQEEDAAKKAKYTAPNKTRYSDNDITYLTKNGYTEDAAIELLSKEKKYNDPATEEEIKKSWNTSGKSNSIAQTASDQQNQTAKAAAGDPRDVRTYLAQGYSMEDAMSKAFEVSQGGGQKTDKPEIEPQTNKIPDKEEVKKATEDAQQKNEKYLNGEDGPVVEEIAPNGRKYTKNDVDYLLNQGYTRESAIELLSKDPKYAKKPITQDTTEQISKAQSQANTNTTDENKVADATVFGTGKAQTPQEIRTVQSQQDTASMILESQNKTNELLGQILAAIQQAIGSLTDNKTTTNPNTGEPDNPIVGTVKSLLTALGGGSNLGMGDKFMVNNTRRGNNQGDINRIIDSMQMMATR